MYDEQPGGFEFVAKQPNGFAGDTIRFAPPDLTERFIQPVDCCTRRSVPHITAANLGLVGKPNYRYPAYVTRGTAKPGPAAAFRQFLIAATRYDR